jgi:outer membrane murein-binding lipoprotein Lpp
VLRCRKMFDDYDALVLLILVCMAATLFFVALVAGVLETKIDKLLNDEETEMSEITDLQAKFDDMAATSQKAFADASTIPTRLNSRHSRPMLQPRRTL